MAGSSWVLLPSQGSNTWQYRLLGSAQHTSTIPIHLTQQAGERGSYFVSECKCRFVLERCNAAAVKAVHSGLHPANGACWQAGMARANPLA